MFPAANISQVLFFASWGCHSFMALVGSSQCHTGDLMIACSFWAPVFLLMPWMFFLFEKSGVLKSTERVFLNTNPSPFEALKILETPRLGECLTLPTHFFGRNILGRSAGVPSWSWPSQLCFPEHIAEESENRCTLRFPCWMGSFLPVSWSKGYLSPGA